MNANKVVQVSSVDYPGRSSIPEFAAHYDLGWNDCTALITVLRVSPFFLSALGASLGLDRGPEILRETVRGQYCAGFNACADVGGDVTKYVRSKPSEADDVSRIEVTRG